MTIAPEIDRHALVRTEQRWSRAWFAHCACGREFTGASRSGARRRLRAHLAGIIRDGCPTPDKCAFDTRYDAETALPKIWAKMKERNAPIRAYECSRDSGGCGKWHLTSKPRSAGH